MAENEPGDGNENIELEPYIHEAGMDPDTAKGLFDKLLSDDPDYVDEVYSDDEPEEEEEVGSKPRQPRGEQDDDAEEVDDDPDLEEDDDSDDEDDLDEEDWWNDDDDLLDDEEDEGEEDEEEDTEETSSRRKHTVKVDGEVKEVTLQELKDGYSFRAHNTQTAQRLAEDRKALDEEAAQVRDERTLYAERLDRLGKMLGDAAPEEPNFDEDDPVAIAKWTRHQQKVQALKEEQERIREAELADAARQFERRRAEQYDVLLERLPRWRDPNYAEREAEAIFKGAIEHYGYTEEQLDLVTDARAVLMMRDAVRYRKQMAAGKAAVEGKRKRRPRSRMRPGSKTGKGTGKRRTKTSRRQQQSRRRLAETHSVRDGEAAIFDLLDD